MTRLLENGIKSRQRLILGINKVADAVSKTLGPLGRNVLVERKKANLAPAIFNDGIMVVNNIELLDEFENAGLLYIKEAASVLNEQYGDGTSTMIVIMQYMINEASKYTTAHYNEIQLRKGMEIALEIVCKELLLLATKITTLDQIKDIANIAGKEEKIGNAMLHLYEKMSMENAFITIEDSNKRELEVEVIDGMRLKTGYITKLMCNNKEKNKIIMKNAYILITDKVIKKAEEVLPIMELVLKEKRALLIIAKDISGEALNTIAINSAKKIIDIACIKAPGHKKMQEDLLNDISIFTNATFIEEKLDYNIKMLSPKMLGTAKFIEIDSENTIIKEGNYIPEILKEHIENIEKLKLKATSIFDKERYIERISKLKGKIGVIKVGADSKIEADELKLKVENAISSVKNAIDSGILAGGGIAYLHVSKKAKETIENLELSEEIKVGAYILINSLNTPFLKICNNAGYKGSNILENIKEKEYPKGFDVYKNEYVDFIKEGIINAAKIDIELLRIATSISKTIITTEGVNVIVRGSEEITNQ